MSPRVWAVAATPLVVGLAWTRHADVIKEASPATRWLTTSNLTDWNFGDAASATRGSQLGPRRRPHRIAARRSLLLGRADHRRGDLRSATRVLDGDGAHGCPSRRCVLQPVRRARLLLIAVAPGFAGLLGLTTDLIWRHATKRVPAVLVVVGFAALWLVLVLDHEGLLARCRLQPTEDDNRDGSREGNPTRRPFERAVVLQGLGWDPTTLYYAHSRGLMLDPRIATQAVAHLLTSPGIRYWYATRPTAQENDLLRTWPWVASTGGRSYRMSQSAGRELGDASLVAALDRPAIEAARTIGKPLTESAVVVNCDGRSQPLPLPFRSRGSISRTPSGAASGYRLIIPSHDAALLALVLRRGLSDREEPVDPVSTSGRTCASTRWRRPITLEHVRAARALDASRCPPAPRRIS
jgi:hypothetical protein